MPEDESDQESVPDAGAVTYESAVEGVQEQTDEAEEHLEGMVNEASETVADVRSSTVEEGLGGLEDISETIPEWLKPDGSDVGDEIGGGRDDITSPSPDLDLSELDNQGILETIARTNLTMVAAMFDIADAVEPRSNIVVSGTNAIDQAGNAQPVVPRADEENIPTRELFLRADPDNTEPVYFGDDGTEPNSGFVLHAGESMNIPLNFNEESLWMASEEEGMQVHLIGLV